eukprot:3515854-Alexandrium_andersonii.AAC.1
MPSARTARFRPASSVQQFRHQLAEASAESARWSNPGQNRKPRGLGRARRPPHACPSKGTHSWKS